MGADTTTSQDLDMLDRDEAITLIRQELRRRSDRPWSIKGGSGTSWGWITITAPPKRLDGFGAMTDDDQKELARLLGVPVHHQGVTIPASAAHRREYLDRAAGRPAVVAPVYWD